MARSPLLQIALDRLSCRPNALYINGLSLPGQQSAICFVVFAFSPHVRPPRGHPVALTSLSASQWPSASPLVPEPARLEPAYLAPPWVCVSRFRARSRPATRDG